MTAITQSGIWQSITDWITLFLLCGINIQLSLQICWLMRFDDKKLELCRCC